jgi:NAD-dependent oxidoreductase involved in siderophore biosynthesis
MPRQAQDSVALDVADDAQLDFASAVTLGPARAPSYREVVGGLWPKAVQRALASLYDCVQGQNDPQHEAQYHLTLTSLWQSVTAKLGYPELLDDAPPCSLSEAIVRDAMARGCVT